MIPGPALTFACPHCGGTKNLLSLISGNTFGGVAWSDAKSIYPMYPRRSPVQRCPHCGKYGFLSDFKLVGDGMAHLDDESKDRFCLETGALNYGQSVEAFRELLPQADGPERVKTLRVLLLHAMNDRFGRRDGSAAMTSDQRALFRDNALALIGLLGEEDLLSAELYREIGEFAECRRLMETIKVAENLASFAEELLRRADAGDSRVFRL